MRKTLVAVAVTVAVMSLTGCGSSSDNSEVLAKLESIEESMNGGFERLETKVESIHLTSSEEAPAEQTTESSQKQTPEQTVETETTQEQVPAEQTSTKLQVSAIHCENRIPVKLVEGKLSEDCISNPTDLNSPTGTHRDLHLLFIGEKIKEVSWIYGTSQERTCNLSPSTGEDGVSYLYFNMEEGNGIYLFEVVTETGKIYSFSVKYYDANVI